MGINYDKYGLDSTAAADDTIARNRAIEWAVKAINADIAVRLETDDEDRTILEIRRDELQARAEELRKEARLTKREIKEFRAQMLQGKQIELAQQHLKLEAMAKGKEAAGESAESERADQEFIETGLAALDQV